MPVFVGLLTVDLRIPEARSLKDKRQVVQSLLDRLGARFNLSVAEVEDNDRLQRARLAAACVSNTRVHCEQQLDRALNLIRAEHRAEVETVDVEIL